MNGNTFFHHNLKTKNKNKKEFHKKWKSLIKKNQGSWLKVLFISENYFNSIGLKSPPSEGLVRPQKNPGQPGRDFLYVDF